MALKGAVRFKPDVYRTSMEATVGSLDPAASPPSGTVYMVAQLVAYDDAVVTGGNYKPGDPATEQNVTVLYEETLSQELAAFAGLTQPQATALWTAALNAFQVRVTPAGPVLLRAIRAARLTPPVVLS